MRKKRKTSVLLGLTLVLALSIFAVYLNYSRIFYTHMQETVTTRLGEIVAPSLVSFDLQVKEQIKKVNTFADFLGRSEALTQEDQVTLLKAAVENNGLLRCAIAFPDGSFITHDNKNEGSVAENPFFIANMRGEFFITDPQPAVVDETKTVILFTAPIHREGEVVGSVIYSYLCDDMDSIFNLSLLSGQGQMLVTKGDGSLLIGHSPYLTGRENLVEALQSRCAHVNHLPEECLALTGETGSRTLTLTGESAPLIVGYQKLGFKDWYMITLVPEDAAVGTLALAVGTQRDLGVSIAICVGVYLLLLFLLWFFDRTNTDKLTGALTGESFRRKAKDILHRGVGIPYVLVKLDVKNFKLINRVYNFTVGDEVIKNIAKALSLVLVGPQTCFARVGVDDFLILLPYEGAEALNERRADFIDRFRILMGEHFTTRVEFPTGQYIIRPEEGARAEIGEFIEKANFAHRAAKQRDWGIIVDYAENLEKEALFEKAIEDKMSQALRNEEFLLYLQPKYRVSDERICGAEALVRWEVDGQYFMHPTAFIPTLERNGFIVKIDYYMFQQAVQRIRSYMDEGCEPITISVNFSRIHLRNERFVEELCEMADALEVPHRYLEIELTESVVFENVGAIRQLIEDLHRVGFTLSMDDFGSGYSSLTLLKDLPVDVLKLDREFFTLGADPVRMRTVLTHVMEMARELQVTTVAEGIETLEQVELLRELGCDIIQGYYYAKPIPGGQLKLPKREAIVDGERAPILV